MKISGFTIAGFVFAIVALLTSSEVSIMMMVAGFILSMLGSASIDKGETKGKGLALASYIMLGVNVVWLIALG